MPRAQATPAEVRRRHRNHERRAHSAAADGGRPGLRVENPRMQSASHSLSRRRRRTCLAAAIPTCLADSPSGGHSCDAVKPRICLTGGKNWVGMPFLSQVARTDCGRATCEMCSRLRTRRGTPITRRAGAGRLSRTGIPSAFRKPTASSSYRRRPLRRSKVSILGRCEIFPRLHGTCVRASSRWVVRGEYGSTAGIA